MVRFTSLSQLKNKERKKTKTNNGAQSIRNDTQSLQPFNLHVRWYDFYRGIPQNVRLKHKSWFSNLVENSHNGKVQSLFKTCVTTVLNNMSNYRSDNFKRSGLPESLAIELWIEAINRGLDCFKLFNDFVSAYPEVASSNEFQAEYKQYRIYQRTNGNLFANRYRSENLIWAENELRGSKDITMLNSTACQWLVFLSLSPNTVTYSYSDLLALTDIVNLAALDITFNNNSSTEPQVFDYRILLHWARQAEEKEAFSKLRLLVLRNHKHLLQQNANVPLLFSKIPNLQYVNLQGCHGSNTLKNSDLIEYGWEYWDDEKSLNLGDARPLCCSLIEEESRYWPAYDLQAAFEKLFPDVQDYLIVNAKLVDWQSLRAAQGLFDRIKFENQSGRSHVSTKIWLKREEAKTNISSTKRSHTQMPLSGLHSKRRKNQPKKESFDNLLFG